MNKINQLWRNGIMMTGQATGKHEDKEANDCGSSHASWYEEEKVWKCGLCKKIVVESGWDVSK